MRKHKDNYIDYDAFIYKDGIGANKGRKVVDWTNSVGLSMKYVCAGYDGYFTILEYIRDKRKAKILINNEEYVFDTCSILDCGFGRRVFKRENLKYKYHIGEKITTNNTTYEVLDCVRDKNNKKSYKVKCLKCGEETIKCEPQLNSKYGCLVCCGKKAKRGFNDIETTNTELFNMLVDKEFGRTHTEYSQIKTDWICPICGAMVKNKSPYTVNFKSLSCPICGKTKSYPNRFMYSLLLEAGIKFNDEKIFKWSDNKRYDFYLPEQKIIIEMQGKQHYDKDFFEPCEKVIKNDEYKKSLALRNGIQESKYLQIDARYSEFDYILEHIKESVLSSVIDLDKINWKRVLTRIEINPLKEACSIWDSGNRDIQSIADIIGYHMSTTSQFLRKGEILGITTYTINESNEIGFEKARDTWYQHNSKPVICNQNRYAFGSYKVFQNNSVNVFGYHIDECAASRIANGKQKDTKKDHLTFSHITKQQFNEIKRTTPEKAFGNFFILEDSKST